MGILLLELSAWAFSCGVFIVLSANSQMRREVLCCAFVAVVCATIVAIDISILTQALENSK